MAEDWASVAAEVADALRSVGSTDAGYPGAIRRVSVTGGDDFDPSSGTETVTYHDCTIVVSEFSTMERASSAIGVTDKKVLIGADAEVEPRAEDRLLVGVTAAEASGVGYEIVRVTPLAPVGTVVMWTAQVRF